MQYAQFLPKTEEYKAVSIDFYHLAYMIYDTETIL